MGRQITPVAPAMRAGLLAALALVLSIAPGRAIDDCLTAPDSQPPPGSQWRYRTEHGRKCWSLRSDTRNKGAPEDAGAREPSAPRATGETLTGRDCDTELSVLRYRKILSGVFQTDSQPNDKEAEELAAKGCRDAGAER